jgi:3-dehydroquinate dehydratase-2
MKLMVLNGPNLNMLGIREPEIYGRLTYEQLCNYLEKQGRELGHLITCYQSNSEGRLIDYLQQAYFEAYEGIIINPGAYTHYSYAIYDALKGLPLPAVEVHLSDIYQREAFRRVSVTAPACLAQISGKGPEGYLEAMQLLQKQGH